MKKIILTIIIGSIAGIVMAQTVTNQMISTLEKQIDDDNNIISEDQSQIGSDNSRVNDIQSDINKQNADIQDKNTEVNQAELFLNSINITYPPTSPEATNSICGQGSDCLSGTCTNGVCQ